MENISRLNPARAMLLLVDIQDAFVGPVKKMKKVIKNAAILAEAADILGIPSVVTEQYPKGLGHTVKQVSQKLNDCQVVEKSSFSCFGQDQSREAILATGKGQVIIAGVEGHVCVAQTVMDLLEAGKEVFVIQDAVSSRNLNDCRIALNRMVVNGATVTTTEAALLEMLCTSRHEKFKAVQALIK